MHPTLVRTAVATALVLGLSSVSACGGDSSDGPQAKRSPAVVETPRTWPPKGGDSGGSSDLATYPYLYGVSWQAPRDWAFKRTDFAGNDSFLWRTGKKQTSRLLSVSIQNSRSTVEEWVKIAANITGVRRTVDEKVSVPGYGQGRHLRLLNTKAGTTQDMLVVTSVDGVLLQLDVYLPKGADTGIADRLVGGVKRGSA